MNHWAVSALSRAFPGLSASDAALLWRLTLADADVEELQAAAAPWQHKNRRRVAVTPTRRKAAMAVCISSLNAALGRRAIYSARYGSGAWTMERSQRIAIERIVSPHLTPSWQPRSAGRAR